MNELAIFGKGSAADQLVRWAEAASAAHGLAKSLCRTAFVPEVFQLRGDAEDDKRLGNATAAILLGAEIGLDPLAALQSVYLIKGSPGIYTETKVALAKAQGHSIWTEAETDSSCTVAGHRKGEPDHVERVTWTMDRVRQAGLQRNENYTKNPRAMLYARAAGDVVRRVAPDVLRGIPQDGDEPVPAPTPTEVPSGTVVRRRVSAPLTAAPEGEPGEDPRQGGQHPADPDAPQRAQGEADQETPAGPVGRPLPGQSGDVLPLAEWEQKVIDDHATPPPDPEDDEPVEESEPLMYGSQRARMMVEFNARGYSREARLAWISDLLSRPVESASDLTVTEAGWVIDNITREPMREGS